MDERDAVRLRDMLDAARKARQFVQNKARTDLDTDEIFAYALVRALEIVGEAASRVSSETRSQYPEIRWAEIIGMRNKMIHDYLSVDYKIVWDVVTIDLPKLIDSLESILPSDTE